MLILMKKALILNLYFSILMSYQFHAIIKSLIDLIHLVIKITLINYIYSTVNINNESVKLYDVILDNYDGNSLNSCQISIKNLEEKIYIVKNTEDFRQINFKYLQKTKKDLEDFNKDFYNM